MDGIDIKAAYEAAKRRSMDAHTALCQAYGRGDDEEIRIAQAAYDAAWADRKAAFAAYMNSDG